MSFEHTLIGQTLGPVEFHYNWQDVSLYALGCGATDSELDLLLETRGPKVLPTYSVVVSFAPLMTALKKLGGNMLTLVHGGQKCTFRRPLPASATLQTTVKVAALYDKGKGALGIFESATRDERGELLFETEWQIFFRGEGGFGGARGPETKVYAPSEGHAPKAVVSMPTRKTLALLYRLGSRDYNPIHADPEAAQKAKFPRPILHGLATFGHAARATINTLCNGDPERLLHIEGRFAKPAFPGDTLVTEIYEMRPGEAYYFTKVSERTETVISNGRVLLKT